MQANPPTARRGGPRATVFVAALLTLLLALAPLAATAAPSKGGASSRPALDGVVNVNTASAEELQLLPGVGPSRAAEIVTVRQRRGGFTSIDDLTEVKGIGATMLERMRPHLALEGRTTARRVGSGAASGVASGVASGESGASD